MTLSIIQLCDFAHVSVTCRTRVYSVNSEGAKKKNARKYGNSHKLDKCQSWR